VTFDYRLASRGATSQHVQRNERYFGTYKYYTVTYNHTDLCTNNTQYETKLSCQDPAEKTNI